jgi:glyoxylase-like metal-dependent hydrolase (beta-lactamase superfamily II)
MTLEDHAGDVVRKARMMIEVPAAEAAAAARIPLEQLTAFESDGAPPAGIDWEGLGRRLELSGSKLRALAEGWQPGAVDLAVWREVRVLTTAGEGMTVNAYLVWDEVTREAALFDTGFDAAPVFALVDSEKLNLQHLFITHTHGDHVAALEPIRTRFPKLRLHTGAKSAPPQHRNVPNAFIHLGSLRITHRETPGHAEDGVTYVVGTFPDDAPNIAIVGDAIFAGSLGGAPGRGALAKGRVREQILSLPGPTLICPGHGPLSTVAEQKAANPFVV